MAKVRAWAGEYNQRVTIWRQETTRSANTDGQRPESGEEWCKRWASVRGTSATEQYTDQTGELITHMVRLRYDNWTKVVTAHRYWITMRDGTRLDIKTTFDVDGRRVELQFNCRQRT